MNQRARAPVRYDEPQTYTVHAAHENGEIVPAATLLLQTDARGRHRQSGLEYLDDWLAPGNGGFDLNPVHAPRKHRRHQWDSDRGIPAIIDEVLPGGWERALLARAWQRDGLGPADIHDLHAVLHEPHATLRVGALTIAPGQWNVSGLGTLRSQLTRDDLELLARQSLRLEEQEELEIEVLRRFQAGSTVGGARPKVLITDGDRDLLVKFNRHQDTFNHARVEHACLELARRSGLPVPGAAVIRTGDLEALELERFDTTAAGGRRHLISVNALLKDPVTCADLSNPSYDDIVRVIVDHSDDPASDLHQLYTQMLVNVAINNLDDHLRNFSFLRGERGLTLSPAYDLVISEQLGGYPQLRVGTEANLPRPATKAARENVRRIFRLTSGEARKINDRIAEAFSGFEEVLEDSGLSERDRRLMRRVCWRPGQ